ncbi:MAG: Na+/H+ antiporter subunit E [Candidatus Muiribacteriaceae bacterium]
MKILIGKWIILRVLVLTLFCFFFWVLISAEFEFYSIIIGMFFSFAVALYSYDLYLGDKELHRSAVIFRADLLILYIILIIVESYFSTWDLIKLVFRRKYNPGVVRIKTRLRSELGRVILANSISLVPGTLSLWLDDRYIYVHWFDKQTINSIKAGRLIKERLERFLLRIFQ